MSLNPGLVARFLFYQATRETVTDFTYRKYLPAGRGNGGVETSGSATTVTAVSGLTNPPFFPVVASDIIQFNYEGSKYLRKVSSVTSLSEIEVDAVVDLSNGTSAWRLFPQRSGSTDADGWVYVGQDAERTVIVDITSLGETTNGITIQVEGKVGHGLANDPLIIDSRGYTSAGQTLIDIPDGIEFVRVGVKCAAVVTDVDVFDIYLTKRSVH